MKNSKDSPMSIPVGATGSETVVVTHDTLASTVGSGQVDVFATPMMIALIERAASACVQGFLEPGMVTVGTHVDVEHSGATPLGMQVTAIVTVSSVDRRKIDFAVVVRDEAGEVGRGSHTRFVVDKDRFIQKASSKKG